jgi:chloramphenicol 3-O phosphotransferase
VDVDVIVLNGGSSSGKSSLAVCLQQRLEGTWLTLGVGSDGSVTVGEEFRQVELAWYQGVAAMARAGARVVLDEVFLNGGSSQLRLATVLEGLTVVWIGVRCHPDVAEAREVQRADRTMGMARDQATRVHHEVRYDFIVDTTRSGSDECAISIVKQLAAPPAN